MKHELLPKKEITYRKFENKEAKKKFYHASLFRYKVGDIINGQRESSWDKKLKGPTLFLTNSSKPHYSLADRENLRDYFIYQVKPLGKIRKGLAWDEYGCRSAEILKIIGKASGFVERGEYSLIDNTKKGAFWKQQIDQKPNPRNKLDEEKIKETKLLLEKIMERKK